MLRAGFCRPAAEPIHQTTVGAGGVSRRARFRSSLGGFAARADAGVSAPIVRWALCARKSGRMPPAGRFMAAVKRRNV